MLKIIGKLAIPVLIGGAAFASAGANATAKTADGCLAKLRSELSILNVVPEKAAETECGKCCLSARKVLFHYVLDKDTVIPGLAYKIALAKFENSTETVFVKNFTLPLDDDIFLKGGRVFINISKNNTEGSFEVDNLTFRSSETTLYYPKLWGGAYRVSAKGVDRAFFYSFGKVEITDRDFGSASGEGFLSWEGEYNKTADEVSLTYKLNLSLTDKEDGTPLDIGVKTDIQLLKVKSLVSILQKLERNEKVDDLEIRQAVINLVPEKLYLKITLGEGIVEKLKKDKDYKKLLLALQLVAEEEKDNLIGKFARALNEVLSGEKESLTVKVVNKEKLTVAQLGMLINKAILAYKKGEFKDSILTKYLDIEIYSR